MVLQGAGVEDSLDGWREVDDVRCHDDDVVHGVCGFSACIALFEEHQEAVAQGFDLPCLVVALVDGHRVVGKLPLADGVSIPADKLLHGSQESVGIGFLRECFRVAGVAAQVDDCIEELLCLPSVVGE